MAARRLSASNPKTVLQAAAFALFVIGGLAAGLGLSTWTVAKANELVFGPVAPQSVAGTRCAFE